MPRPRAGLDRWQGGGGEGKLEGEGGGGGGGGGGEGGEGGNRVRGDEAHRHSAVPAPTRHTGQIGHSESELKPPIRELVDQVAGQEPGGSNLQN